MQPSYTRNGCLPNPVQATSLLTDSFRFRYFVVQATKRARGLSDMAIYVLYCLDGAGKITRSDPLEAEHDTQALERARELKLLNECELWLRDRCIGRVPARR